jgi:transposase
MAAHRLECYEALLLFSLAVEESQNEPVKREKHVKDMRWKTRRESSLEVKVRIFLDGLRTEYSIAEPCRREGGR